MRRLALALVVAASATSASANPLDFLRGAIMDGVGGGRVEWGGYYAGVHAATGTSDMNFTNSNSDIIAKLLDGTAMQNEFQVSDWPVMGKKSASGSGIGGFLGYNAVWSDAVLGFELNYMRGKFGGSDTGTVGRFFTTSNGYRNDVTVTGTSSIDIKDLASARLRAGWAAGMFMPYVFGGGSFGIADITRTVAVFGTQTNTVAPFDVVPFSLSQSSIQPSHFIYGYAFGAGVDIMLFGNAFLRAEWEYLKFAAPIDTSVSTVRAGLGMKF